MTAPTRPRESKLCPVCEKRFYRRKEASPSSFRSQITCSRKCGNVHAANPEAHPPKPEPRVLQREASPEWRTHAACRNEEADLFFPIGTTGPALRQIREAKAVCAGCSVLAACREWAMDVLEYGVAGGLDEEERRALRQRRAKSRAVAS